MDTGKLVPRKLLPALKLVGGKRWKARMLDLGSEEMEIYSISNKHLEVFKTWKSQRLTFCKRYSLLDIYIIQQEETKKVQDLTRVISKLNLKPEDMVMFCIGKSHTYKFLEYYSLGRKYCFFLCILIFQRISNVRGRI
jgi:hypothetical protein